MKIFWSRTFRVSIFVTVFVVSLLFVFTSNAFIGPGTLQPGSGGGQLRLDPNGNIGFGSASGTPSGNEPSGAFGRVFMIASSTNPGLGLRNLSGGDDPRGYILYSKGNGSFQIWDDKAFQVRFVIDKSGNVGIATTTPTAPLVVVGDATITGTLTAGTIAGGGGSVAAGNVMAGSFGSNTGGGNYTFPSNLTVDTSTLFVDATSNQVGIGTVSPGARLTVTGSGIWDGAAFELNNTGASGRRWTIFSTNSSFSQGAGKLLFYNTTASSNALVIDSSNNVGVGTTSPAYKLDVQGGQVNTSGGLCIAGDCKTAWSQVGGGGATATTTWNRNNSSGYIFLVTSTDSVGIGTASPGSKLTVAGLVESTSGGFKFPDGTTQTTAATGGGGGGGSSYWSRDASGGYVYFVTSTDKLIVGNGLSNAEKLQVVDSSTGAVSAGIRNTSNGGSAESFINVSTAGGGDARVLFRVNEGGPFVDWSLGIDNSDGDKFKIDTGTGIDTDSVFNIVGSSGNVGLGIGSPSYRLDVVGDVNTTGQYRIGGIVVLRTPDSYLNTFVGKGAGSSTASGGYSNVAIGRDALYANTLGSNNTAVGYNALYSNTQASNNIAVGAWALDSNTTGNSNVAFGVSALTANLVGIYNTAVGDTALGSNTGGQYNVAVGASALGANTNGDVNVAVGLNALRYTDADWNTGIGHYALYSNTTGIENVALGTYAGYTLTSANANTTGSSNVFVGFGAGPGTPTQLTNAIAIGQRAIVSSNNTMALGGVGGYAVSVGIGTSSVSSGVKLQVIGDIRVGTSGTNGCIQRWGGGVLTGACSSDLRLKKNIVSLRSVLSDFSKLNPVHYNWNEKAEHELGMDGSMKNLGLISQEVEKVFPELVTVDDKGYKRVDFTALQFYSIKAIQEQQTQIQRQQKEIDELKRVVDLLSD